MISINSIDAVTFAYIVIGFGLSSAFIAIVFLIFSDKSDTLMSNDEYDKKVIKKRKKKK